MIWQALQVIACSVSVGSVLVSSTVPPASVNAANLGATR